MTTSILDELDLVLGRSQAPCERASGIETMAAAGVSIWIDAYRQIGRRR
jgi:hypothetical protein